MFRNELNLPSTFEQVVANAVAALTEIMETSSTAAQVVDMNTQIINKLLTALNECTEWGQVFILDAVSNYVPKDEREAQSICERITPRLAHANSAIVLSSVKVIMKLMEMMDPSSEVVSMLIKKLAPPMVTLLSAEQETQYVALRNINLIVQKRFVLLFIIFYFLLEIGDDVALFGLQMLFDFNNYKKLCAS